MAGKEKENMKRKGKQRLVGVMLEKKYAHVNMNMNRNSLTSGKNHPTTKINVGRAQACCCTESVPAADIETARAQVEKPES